MLEKPMATTLQDSMEIKRLAEGYQSVFQIGLQYRYKAIYVEAIHEALEHRLSAISKCSIGSNTASLFWIKSNSGISFPSIPGER